MDDLKNVGESNYNPGDGTDQRVQSLVFMMMMILGYAVDWSKTLEDLFSVLNVLRHTLLTHK